MSSYTLKTIDELESIHHGLVRLAGAELDLGSFGMQILDMPAGFDSYPEHDHSEDGQEEVYLVLSGSADVHVDGEQLRVGQGQLLRVAPHARRKLVTGTESARILAIGAAADRPYQRPDDFQLEVRA